MVEDTDKNNSKVLDHMADARSGLATARWQILERTSKFKTPDSFEGNGTGTGRLGPRQ